MRHSAWDKECIEVVGRGAIQQLKDRLLKRYADGSTGFPRRSATKIYPKNLLGLPTRIRLKRLALNCDICQWFKMQLVRQVLLSVNPEHP